MHNYVSCIVVKQCLTSFHAFSFSENFGGVFVARSKYYIFIHNGILEIKYTEDMQSNLIFINKKVQI